MPKGDLYHKMIPIQMLKPQSLTPGRYVSDVLDTKAITLAGIEASFGTYTVGSGTGVEWILEHSDSLEAGSFEAVDAIDMNGTLTGVTDASDDCTVYLVSYHGARRYLRAVVLVSTSSTTILTSITGLCMAEETEPSTLPTSPSQQYFTQVYHLQDCESLSAGTVKTPWVDTTDALAVYFKINYGVFTPNTAATGVTAALYEHATTADTGATEVAAADISAAFDGVAVDASDDQRSEMIQYLGSVQYVGVNLVVPADSTSLVAGIDAIVVKAAQYPLTAGSSTART